MTRTTVFVSYSHVDRAWLDRLRIQLKPLERDGRIELWDDTRIKPGSSWRDDIRQALQSARVAVLLVSADFLASEFIAENELPPLLKAAKEDGATILPIIISPCLFTDTPQLMEFQAVNDPAKPLVAMKKNSREQVFLKVARAVQEAFDKTDLKRPTPWRGTRTPDPTGLQLWGAIDKDALRRLRPLEVMTSTPHSTLQKYALDDAVYVVKGTRAQLCDVEALRQLVTGSPRPLPIGADENAWLAGVGIPRAIWLNDDHVWELQQYYEGQSLADIVARSQKPLAGRPLFLVVEVIANILEALYQKELVHADINPGNILDVGRSNFRLVDWSSCCQAASSPAKITTPGYSPPEQEGDAGQAICASDWYSLGATCFALANGFTPHERGPVAFEQGLRNIQLGTDFRGWEGEDLVGRLLSADPAARPKPWQSRRELFDIRRDSKPNPRLG